MSLANNSTRDDGNAALEVLLVALVGGIAVCWLSFHLFATQRDGIAAHQLARQAARAFVLSGGEDQAGNELAAQMARDLNLTPSDVSLRVKQEGQLVRAVASVSGVESWAVMWSKQ